MAMQEQGNHSRVASWCFYVAYSVLLSLCSLFQRAVGHLC